MGKSAKQQTEGMKVQEEQIRAKICQLEDSISQQRARLSDLSNRRKSVEKKLERAERDRRLFTVGGLAELAEIGQWDKNTLLGAFLAIARKSHDTEMMKRWSLDGANLHAKQAASNEKSRAAQGIALPKKPSAGGITELESGS